MKHTKKQVLEAIRHWESQLELMSIDEAFNMRTLSRELLLESKDGCKGVKEFVARNRTKAEAILKRGKGKDKKHVSMFKDVWSALCRAVENGASFLVKHASLVIQLALAAAAAFMFWPMFKKLCDSSSKDDGVVKNARELLAKGVDSADALVSGQVANNEAAAAAKSAAKIVQKGAADGEERLAKTQAVPEEQKSMIQHWVDDAEGGDKRSNGMSWTYSPFAMHSAVEKYGHGSRSSRLMRVNAAIAALEGPRHDDGLLKSLMRTIERECPKALSFSKRSDGHLGTVHAGHGKVDLDAGLIY